MARAPADGTVTYVGLRPGARVADMFLFRTMAFIDTSEPILGAQIPQNFSQHIQPGQHAEDISLLIILLLINDSIVSATSGHDFTLLCKLSYLLKRFLNRN